MGELTTVRVDHLPEPISHYTDAVCFGDLVFVSGCTASNTEGRVDTPDVVEQARVALNTLQEILAAAGSDLSHVAKVTIFLTDINDRAAINPVRQELFGQHRPASTLVEISRLAVPGAKIEIEAVAVIADGRTAR